MIVKSEELLTSPTDDQERSATDFLGLSTEECIEVLRLMIVSRRFEEKAAEVYQTGKIGGFCHLYTGQEAVAVGAITALRSDDYVITAYRDHAQALVRGISPNAVMAESDQPVHKISFPPASRNDPRSVSVASKIAAVSATSSAQVEKS